MKKNQNKLDKLFSDKLQHNKLEANEQDWSEMKSMLDERDKTGFWLSKRFYILLALLALGGISSVFYFASTDNKKSINKSELSIVSSEIENINSSATKNSGLRKNGSVDNAESSSVESASATIKQDVVNANNPQETFSTELFDRNENGNNNTTNNLLEPKQSNQELRNNFENTVYAKSEDAKALSDDIKINSNSSNDRMAAEPVIAESNESANNKRTQNFESNSNDNQKLNDIKIADEKDTSGFTNPVLGGAGESLESGKNAADENEKSNRSIDDQFQSNASNKRRTETEKPMPDSNAVAGTNNPGSTNSGNSNPSSDFKYPPSDIPSSNKIAEPTISEQNSPRVLDTNNAAASPPILIVSSDSAQKSNSQGNFSIGMTLSSAFISKKLKANGTIHSDYLKRRENEESNTIEFHGGLTASYNFKNFLVETGLEYATYSEKTEYKPISKFTIKDSTYVLIPDSNTGGGNNFDTVYTVFSNEVDTVNNAIAVRNGKTQWRYLEIPLMVWYRMEKEKYLVDAGFGTSFGMLQKVNSYYLNNEITDLEDVNSTGNYRDFVYNILLATRFSYKLDANWLIGIDLRYKQNISSVFKSDYPVEQKYRSLNTGISLMYRLNGKD